MSLRTSGLSRILEEEQTEAQRELELGTVLLPADVAVTLHSRGAYHPGDLRQFYYMTVFSDDDHAKCIQIHTVKAIRTLRDFLDKALLEIDKHHKMRVKLSKQDQKRLLKEKQKKEKAKKVLESI